MPQHSALAAVRAFTRNVLGDIRILQRELENDPESKIAFEETARFLGQLSQEMLAGVAPQPERPGMSLAALGQQRAPEPAAPPEDDPPPSAAAALIGKIGGF